MQRISFSWLAVSLPLMLVACGGSSVGGDGQDPDPVVEDFPIAYIARPVPRDEDGNIIQSNLKELDRFRPGARLVLRERAAATAEEIVVTATAFEQDALYDVKDLEVSYDGNKLLFAMRAPEIEDADEEDQPSWNIWEYDITSSTLRRIIPDDVFAEIGDDIAPHYLPDGRIVFASTRQTRARAILLDDGKPQFSALEEDRDNPAFVLHVMNEDGTGIEQLTFNQSHDTDPMVLDDGRIAFTRWDNINNRDKMSLYRVNRDGTQLEQLFGYHSHDVGTNGATVQYVKSRRMPNGEVLSLVKPFEQADDGYGDNLGSDLWQVNVSEFVEADRSIFSGQVGSNSGVQSLTVNDITTDSSISPGGRYQSAFPLWDGTDRLLVSWSQCRIQQADDTIIPCPDDLSELTEEDEEAPPFYGIWIYNPANQTQLPIVLPEESTMYTDVVALQPSDLPSGAIVERQDISPSLLNRTQSLQTQLETEGAGLLHIKSVYDFDGQFNGLGVPVQGVSSVAAMADPATVSADERPARFLRVVKGVSIPDDDVYDFSGRAFGASRAQLMREIIGYAPIEPDGSVLIKVPADVPLMLSVLDQYGRRIGGRHQNWLQLKAGEIVQCNGCHTTQSEVPHGRFEALPPAINSGAPTTGVPFPNTVANFSPDMGETMAETRTRINTDAMEPSVDLLYSDVWTDPNVRTPDPDLNYQYADLDASLVAPTTQSCLNSWEPGCRITINYEQHIHPLWELERPVLDQNGMEVANNRCTSCHGPEDANGDAQVPAAQLDLNETSNFTNVNEWYESYEDLFRTDEELIVEEGVLKVRIEEQPVVDENGDPVFERDEDGNLVLDENGDPIQVIELVTFNVGPYLNTGGARANSGFFDLFLTGSHQGYLSDAELRLIAEWMDVGAQYYNNPFEAPED